MKETIKSILVGAVPIGGIIVISCLIGEYMPIEYLQYAALGLLGLCIIGFCYVLGDIIRGR